MADQQIDELSLKIEVKQNNVAKDIDAISAAIDKLTASLKGMKELSGVLDKLAKVKIPSSITKATGRVAGAAPKLKTEEVFATRSPVGINALSNEEVFKRISAASAECQINIEKNVVAIDKINQAFDSTNKPASEMASNLEKVVEKLEAARWEQEQSEKSTKKQASAWSKLVKSIGRIAFYRAIRTALKEITQAAKEGLGNLRTIDKDLDTSMKKISLSGITIKNSFAAILSPIIKSIQPLITRLADGIARIVNRITEARAALAGQSKYTKIVTSDMTEYQEQLDKTQDSLGSLLEFDTFTLQQRGQEQEQYVGTVTSPVEMTVDEAGDVLEKFEAIKSTLIAIAATIAGMVVLSKISYSV